MKVYLTEVFGVDEPQYMMGIAFETIGHDENKDSVVKRRGWEVPYTIAGIHDIDAYANKYYIPGRRYNDPRKSWESEEPFTDGMTGEETYYILVIKNVDGSDISKKDFSEINDALNNEDGGSMGVQVSPRPLMLNY